MRIHRTTAAVFVLHCMLIASSFGQYDVERVMGKSFEQTDFFFTPYRFLPYGIGSFKNAVPGSLDDPFLELDINPARLYHDTSGAGYLTVDFRSAREITDSRSTYYPGPIYRTAVMDRAMYIPYPQFYLRTRRELEPAVSLAYLFRPQSETWNSFSFGATYQLITQDEDYYSIPQDIYRSVLGADYLGARSAGTDNIPIVDRYSGANEMHQEGHFASVFAGVDLTPRLQFGAKLGMVSFERDGSYGSSNLWQNGSPSSSSLWKNLESRTQSYGHWEGFAGLRYTFEDVTTIGISAGRLEGTADQSLPRVDSSYYSYGPIEDPIGNWSEYSSAGVQDQSWNREGGTTILGADLSSQLTPDRRFQLMYQYSRQVIDIAMDGSIRDGSSGRNRYQYDTTVSRYESAYAITDVRTGSGTMKGTSHHLMGTYQWKIGERVTLSLGGQFELKENETSTYESVQARRYSRYSATGSYQYSSFDSTAETKTLWWTFNTRMTRLTIPIFITFHASDKTEFLFGLNRIASNWRADDVTLAIFDRRYHANESGVTDQQNFGERYTQPRERMSEVRTAFMAGVTVTPTPSLSIRFLGVPNFVDTYYGSELSDVQLWISVTVRP